MTIAATSEKDVSSIVKKLSKNKIRFEGNLIKPKNRSVVHKVI